jgi:hypothetical protein
MNETLNPEEFTVGGEEELGDECLEWSAGSGTVASGVDMLVETTRRRFVRGAPTRPPLPEAVWINNRERWTTMTTHRLTCSPASAWRARRCGAARRPGGHSMGRVSLSSPANAKEVELEVAD